VKPESSPVLVWESMPKDPSEQSRDAPRRKAETPLSALEWLRRQQLDRESATRREMQLAALEVSGEVGYRQLTVQRILERAGASRARFYKSFADKADCYARGYELAIERLEEDLLGPGVAAPDWLAGFRRALDELAGFLQAQPLLAKGLLAEVHVAGGAALAKRKEVFERLSRTVDAARRENESHHSPPPIAASFILNAVEAAVVRTFIHDEPQEFAASVPDLVYIAASVYFGEEVARAASELG
jgi:AcrR family transcriptional regulator